MVPVWAFFVTHPVKLYISINAVSAHAARHLATCAWINASLAPSGRQVPVVSIWARYCACLGCVLVEPVHARQALSV